MCKTLDKAGVPPESHWRSLILYLRDLGEHTSRSISQKKQFQQLLVEQIKAKDYSPENFLKLSRDIEAIINGPCLHRLDNAIVEAAKLLEEFQGILSERRGNVEILGTTTITRVESGMEPQMLLAELRSSFHDIISDMDADIDNLHTLSKTDSLTGLYNRGSIDEFIKKAVALNREDGTNFSVIFLDIDHFKKFNDDYGHRIGDQALATVATITKQSLQKIQGQHDNQFLVGRYGGEEFIIALPGLIEKEASEFAEFLRDQLENYNFIIRNKHGGISRKNISITASLGVAELQSDWPAPRCEYLLDAADQAMYQAKSSGRNQVCCHSAMEEG